MISREHRFHSFNSVQRVYRSGNRVRGALISLQYAINERRQTYRVAIVVSRKVNKSAVRRNRIRRRLYEVVRSYQDQITKPYDMVLTVYGNEINELSEVELNKLIKTQLLQACILESPKPSSQHAIVGNKDS